jgi:hypothetical protein
MDILDRLDQVVEPDRVRQGQRWRHGVNLELTS